MSSKKDRLSEEFSQEMKKPIKKKKLDPEAIKKLAEQEHSEVEEVREKSIPGKPSKQVHRTTIDVPRTLWTEVKKAAADEYLSIKDYLLMLVKRDLKERKQQ